MTIISNENIKNFILSIVLFLFSLENHGNIRLAFAAIIIILSLLLLKTQKIPVKPTLLLLKTSSLLLFISLLSLFSIFTYKENMGEYNSVEFFYSTQVKIFLIILFFYIIKDDKNSLCTILKYSILFHVSIFFIQLAMIYTTGIYPDFLFPFTGEASRYTWGVKIPIIGSTYRPTGMFNEPSTYFSILLPFVILRYYLSNKLSRVDCWALLSFYLTLSFAAIIISSIFIIIINLTGKKIHKLIPFVILLLIVLTPLLINFYELRTSGNYDAIGIRQNLNNALLEQPLSDLLFGNGPVGVPLSLEYLYLSNALSWTKNGFAAINDNGLMIFIIMKFGVIGMLFLILIIYKNIRIATYTLVCLLPFATKIKLTSLTFIFFIFVIILFSKERKNENRFPNKLP
ncbi:hypothetical protein [Providencia sp. 2024EL-00732]|uniref:hypothetical protein n=1 Tax=Providencia sp. 2024EL-00732 TaxID=3374242 RepID=UPI0024AC0E2D|nr:hypothetical protein [Providencia rettgeri]